MNQNRLYPFVRAVSAAVVILCAVMLIRADSSAADIRKCAGIDVCLLRTVEGCSRFKDLSIHPDRYILSSAKTYPYPPPAVYDINSNTLTTINLRTLKGMPVPPQATGAEVSRLKLAGGYWKIYFLDIIRYDGESNPAGALLIKEETRKTIAGAPPCGRCGRETALVEKYQRYYCYDCRAYVDEKDYLKDVRSHLYVSFDPKEGSVNWIAPMKDGDFQKIGVDPSGKYYYFYDSFYFYGRERTGDTINLHRFNIQSRKIDWSYAVKTPERFKDKAPPSYDMHAYASPDFSTIVLWEYDEEYDAATRRGWLQDPPAQAHIVNVRTGSHFSLPAPSTAYGQSIDPGNRYLVLGSNQHGTIHRFDLAQKKADLTVQGQRGMFCFVLSASGKNLYIFTKTGVEVRSWPDMKPVKTIPLNRIFPGVQKLLASETMIATRDGRSAVIGVLKKSSHGPWYSSDLEAGFYLLGIGD